MNIYTEHDVTLRDFRLFISNYFPDIYFLFPDIRFSHQIFLILVQGKTVTHLVMARLTLLNFNGQTEFDSLDVIN